MSEPWPLVLVKWLDHVSVDPWRVVSDFEDEPHECLTAGWLVKETDKFIAVAGTSSDHDGETTVCCVMVIVKSCIIEQRTL